MVQLAIKGHATRGKEVIEILEMLGGKNESSCCGLFTSRIYFIDINGCIVGRSPSEHMDYLQLTLEEFREKFPYKVGDKVSSKYLKNYRIQKMGWEDTNNRVIYKLQGMGWYSVDELQPYKEETMEEKLEQIIFDIPNEYEFFGINDDNQVVLAKKQPIYPKTYEECCEILMDKTNFQDFSLVLTKLSANINEENSISPEPPHITLINNFYKLLICRDAYWKIAGEQMGLGKPWKPDWREERYIIYRNQDDIIGGYREAGYVEHHILAFPTKEMRDAFFENFKESIEECKELL